MGPLQNSRGSRNLVILLSVVAVGLCVWLIVFRPGRPSSPVAPSTPESVGNPSVSPDNKGARPITEVEQKTPVTTSDKATSVSLAGAADPFSGMTNSPSIRFDLAGRVFGENVDGLEGAAVQVFDLPGLASREPLLEAKTDAGGFYAFHDVPPSIVLMQVSAEGHIGQTANLDTSKFLKPGGGYWNGKQLNRDFHLTAGGLSLRGRVMAKDTGDPIQDARILFLLIKKQGSISQTTTDGEGRFRLDGLSPDSGMLTVTAKGYTSASKPGVAPGSKEVEVVLDTGGHRIGGRVIGARSHKPIPDAIVSIVSGSNVPLFVSVITADAEGRFVTPDLAPGEYNLQSQPPDGPCSGPGTVPAHVSITATSPEETEVELVAFELITERGWVREKGTEKPVAGAVVRGGMNPVVTDDEGRFQLEVCSSNPANRITLTATAPGFEPETISMAATDSNGDTNPITLHLPRGLVFSGTVRDESGVPVEGADIAAAFARAYKFSATTDPDGRFETTAPPETPGWEITVIVTAPEKGSLMEHFRWPKDQSSLERDFTLTEGKELRVVVLDKDDKGVAGLTVRLDGYREESIPRHSAEAVTNSDGAAVFRHLPPSYYAITVKGVSDSAVNYGEKLDMAKVESPYILVVHLDESEWTVTGHVTDPDGKPLEGVQIQASSISSRRSTTTDADGFYRLALHDDFYSDMVFSLEGYEVVNAPPKFNGTRNAVSDQVLKPLGRIFGRVVGPDGQPLQTTVELAVFMKDRTSAAGGGSGMGGVSNAGGESGGDSMAYPIGPVGPAVTTALADGGGFEIRPRSLVSGNYYSVRVNEPAFGSGQSNWVQANRSRRIGPLEIRLSWRGLKGRVVDAETGQPLAGAIVTLHLLSNQKGPFDWGKAAQRFEEPTKITDSQGRYELEPVPAGRGNVFVYHADYGVQRFSYTMDAKGSESVAMDLPMALRVDWKGRLLYHDGTPVTQWELTAMQTVDPALGMAVFTARSKDSYGAPNSFHLAPLAPGAAKFDLTLLSQGSIGTSTIYGWDGEIPKIGERKDDLVLPPLVPVQITFPAREDRFYKIVSSTKDFSRIWFSFNRHSSSPAVMAGTVLLPPGPITFRASSFPAIIPPPGATPTPSLPEIEVDIPETGPFQIQLP